MSRASSLQKAVRPPVAEIIHQCRQTLYLAFGLSFLVEMLSLAPLLYMLSVYDRVIGARSAITLVSLTLLVVGIYVFWSALEWIRERLMVRLSMRVDWDLGADVFDASFRRHVTRRNVNVHQLLGDLMTVRQFIVGKSLQALMDAPFALIFIIIGALFHPFLAVFVLVATLVMVVAAYASQKITAPIMMAANDENAEASRVAAGSLRQAEAALALGMMGAIRKRWYDRHRKYLQYQVNATEATGLLGGFSEFLGKALPSLMMGLGAWLAIEGLITGGMVIAATMLLSKSVSPLQKLLMSWKDVVNARQAYDRLNILLSEDDRVEERMQLPAPTGKLDVVGAVAVPPGTAKPVVADINFSLKPGEAIGIVGPSAAGKTCLTRLLIGVWRPARGSVRLDGVELSEWNHDEVGPYMGYVPQEIEFFEGTIAENIARLGPVDPEKVVEAAKKIGFHEVVLTFPEGYDTRIGDSGFALSGGQRQRLAIARAIYGSPRYIIMDEPNANLDEVGENALIEAITELKKQGCSIIITTHRPRLLAVADKLLVLRAGRQVGYGPTKELIAAVRNVQVVNNDGKVAPVAVPAPAAEPAPAPAAEPAPAGGAA